MRFCFFDEWEPIELREYLFIFAKLARRTATRPSKLQELDKQAKNWEKKKTKQSVSQSSKKKIQLYLTSITFILISSTGARTRIGGYQDEGGSSHHQKRVSWNQIHSGLCCESGITILQITLDRLLGGQLGTSIRNARWDRTKLSFTKSGEA